MKKILSLVLAALLALSCVSFASAEEEPFVLSVMLPDFFTDITFVKEGNPILDYIQEKTGVKLDIQFQANSTYGDILSVTLADPATMPNVISFPGRDNTYIKNVSAFWDLTDYVKDAEAYPNLAAPGSANVYANSAVDGRVYGIFRARAYPRAGIYYRSDIAAQMGVTEEPTTIEELTELAEALAAYSEDTYALNMIGNYTAGTISIITVAMGAPNTWGVAEDGSIYAAHEHPAYLEGLKWLRHLYEIGGIAPDFITRSSSDWNTFERTSECFMRFDCNDNAHRQQEWFEANEGVTEQIFEEIGGLVNDEGNICVWPQNAGYAGLVAITKTVAEEDLPKVLSFLDWCNTQEGQMVLNYGLEGLNYWIWDDECVHLYPVEAEGDPDLQKKYSSESDKIHGSLNQLHMGTSGDQLIATAHSPLRDEYAANNNYYSQYVVANPCLTLTSDTYLSYGSTLDTMLSDAAVQFIACKIDEEALKAVWADWAEQGGETIKAEYTAAYEAAHAE